MLTIALTFLTIAVVAWWMLGPEARHYLITGTHRRYW